MDRGLCNLKVANHSDDVFTIYDKTRPFIKDKKLLVRFDKMMGTIDMEEDADEFFQDAILDYMNSEVAPKGYAFGVHAISQDIGFWKFNPKTDDLDLKYEGMVDRRDEEEIEEDDEDEIINDADDEDDDGEGDFEDDEPPDEDDSDEDGFMGIIARGVSDFLMGPEDPIEGASEEEDEPPPRRRSHTRVVVHQEKPRKPKKQSKRRGRKRTKDDDVPAESGVAGSGIAEILDEAGAVVGTTPVTFGSTPEGNAAPGGNDPVQEDVEAKAASNG
jgi:hypothetical protein